MMGQQWLAEQLQFFFMCSLELLQTPQQIKKININTLCERFEPGSHNFQKQVEFDRPGERSPE